MLIIRLFPATYSHSISLLLQRCVCLMPQDATLPLAVTPPSSFVLQGVSTSSSSPPPSTSTSSTLHSTTWTKSPDGRNLTPSGSFFSPVAPDPNLSRPLPPSPFGARPPPTNPNAGPPTIPHRPQSPPRHSNGQSRSPTATSPRLTIASAASGTSSVSSSTSKSTSSLVECPVCYEGYDDRKHQPRELPCGHTICISDLVSLLNSPVPTKCPECRQPFPQQSVPPGEVPSNKKFPINYTVIRIAEAMTHSSSSTGSVKSKKKSPSAPKLPKPSAPQAS